MALFGSNFDSRFILGITRELINNYIDIEVGVYQISLEDTESNIYGESNMKIYYDPVRVHALIEEDTDSLNVSEVGYDINRSVTFHFVKEDLEKLNLYLQAGDIISWDNDYYEIDLVEKQRRWGLRNPDTHLATIEKKVDPFGYKVSISCNAHLTRISRIQLVSELRTGIDDVEIRSEAQRRNSMYGE